MIALWIAYAALLLLNLLCLWAWGPFFKAYAGEKGKRLATREDIEQIRAELRLQTHETELIKAQISRDLWMRQIHWNQRRDLYGQLLDVVNQLARLTNQISTLSSVEEYMHPGRLEELKSKYSDARSNLIGLYGLAELFLNPAVYKNMEEYLSARYGKKVTEDNALQSLLKLRSHLLKGARHDLELNRLDGSDDEILGE